ncbi:MAG: cation diffusion facilitator family transporter [Clostridiales bacterium]|jgi:cation diffusion facilitator family transporter|nr:cation diffusion facilitator family transporter [Clostridiales bacterium]
MSQETERACMRAANVSIAVNAALAAGKLAAGIIGRSGAMLSDAVHTLSDVLSTVVVIAGVKLAGRDDDEDHPYGHERFECVAAIILASMLFATGAGIGYSSVTSIIAGGGASEPPGVIALAAAGVSVIVKEWMYWYTRATAREVGSGALMADAWHHRSDALSSVGSFAGIFGARMGLGVLDPAAGVVICAFILKAAVDIFRDAAGKMTDHAAHKDVETEMRETILSDPDVVAVDELKTRVFGNRVYVDVDVSGDGGMTLVAAHAMAHRVHDMIETGFPAVKHCMVHVNPADAKGAGD